MNACHRTLPHPAGRRRSKPVSPLPSRKRPGEVEEPRVMRRRGMEEEEDEEDEEDEEEEERRPCQVWVACRCWCFSALMRWSGRAWARVERRRREEGLQRGERVGGGGGGREVGGAFCVFLLALRSCLVTSRGSRIERERTVPWWSLGGRADHQSPPPPPPPPTTSFSQGKRTSRNN